MVSNSSLPSGGPSVFSFDSQSAVMQLLASVRKSELSITQKNELRDLIFLYTNGGHDASVRITLEQKITAYNLKPVVMRVTTQPEPEKNLPTIGTFRATPAFAVKAPVQPVAREPEPVKESSTVTPIKVEVKDEVVQSPVTATQPAPVVPTPVVEIQTPVNETIGSTEESLERIRTIKSLVNEKVGNPVHLVEYSPEVGREYMGALLDAMKKINSGSSAVAAMARLESAYEAVEKVIKNPLPQKSPVVQPTVQSEPVVSPALEPLVPTPPAVSPVHIANLAEVSNRARSFTDEELAKSVPQPSPKPNAQPQPEPVMRAQVTDTPSYVQTEAPAGQSGFANAVPASPVVNRVPVHNSERQVSERSSQVPIQSTSRNTFATDGHDEVRNPSPRPVTLTGTPAAPNAAPISPLSALSSPLIKGPRSMEVEPSASNPSGDPLLGADVDTGLQQLLEEWPLFQKSGLFGTGPKGREHPLFKKLSGLQIPLLLAGRFEGATQEIKQSITDYMNGWRYEQGLIYEQGETFEHYLRRVIRHILDLQKNKV